jgi:hypothetical protein
MEVGVAGEDVLEVVALFRAGRREWWAAGVALREDGVARSSNCVRRNDRLTAIGVGTPNRLGLAAFSDDDHAGKHKRQYQNRVRAEDCAHQYGDSQGDDCGHGPWNRTNIHLLQPLNRAGNPGGTRRTVETIRPLAELPLGPRTSRAVDRRADWYVLVSVQPARICDRRTIGNVRTTLGQPRSCTTPSAVSESRTVGAIASSTKETIPRSSPAADSGGVQSARP